MGAAVLQGAAVVTRDLDLWIDLPWRHYLRVSKICQQLGAQLHSPSAAILKGEHLVNFLYTVTGLNSFDYEYRRAEKISWFGRPLRVLPMERIIKSKKAILRPKDLPHIAYLEELLAGAKPEAQKRAAARVERRRPPTPPPRPASRARPSSA